MALAGSDSMAQPGAAEAAPRDRAALVWFRRDLRSYDHAALHHALVHTARVHCVFVFDTEILEALPSRSDRRVEFIWESVAELKLALEKLGGGLIVRHGRARDEVPALARQLGVAAVYANRDYEPQAMARDAEIARELAHAGIEFLDFKDQAIFDRDEIVNRGGKPFAVYGPYKQAWLGKLNESQLRAYPVERHAAALAPAPRTELPALDSLGFARTNLKTLRMPTGMSGARTLLEDFLPRMVRYHERRDFPALRGPSYLSVHLRFGTISVRELARAARAVPSQGTQVWLSELIWRDFYFMILFHHPRVVEHAFQQRLDGLHFSNDAARFHAWCEGRTGYPLIDAAMRQINQTGYMHNRLRMVTASFLVKDLHVDWRWGERYFAQRLNDYDLATNNGGWQWAASTGTDAQPWFRIFNPMRQSEKFDPQGCFIRMYLPELARVPNRHIHAPWVMSAAEQATACVIIGRDYPPPIVDHAQARQAALELYGEASGIDPANAP